jgi:hypothetical protein
MEMHAKYTTEGSKIGGRKRERQRGRAHGGEREDSGQADLVAFSAHHIYGGDETRGVPIRPEKILFAFTAGAVNPGESRRKQPSIVAKWAAKLRFSSGVVYLRTSDGVYRSRVRTLKEFKQLVSNDFDTVSHSVVANLWGVEDVSLGREKVKTLAYAVVESGLSWPMELIVVKRSFLKRIRERFGIK